MAVGEETSVFDCDKFGEEDLLFANEDRNKFENDFLSASSFLRDMFNDVLPKYKLAFLAGSVSQKLSSFYCVNIGEAVIALSYVHRHTFKLLFDKKLNYFKQSESNCEIFVYEFCKYFYENGYVEQFLIMCGFLIDFTIYYYLYFKKNLAPSIQLLFGDIFRYVLRDTFYQKGGGWIEVEKKARSWWHAYRNIVFRQNEDQAKPNPSIPQNKLVDFHNPCYELSSMILIPFLKDKGYSVKIKTVKDPAHVELDPGVPCGGKMFSHE